MIEILKKEVKVQDKVKLYLTIGKEIEVEVIELGDNYVVVKQADGTITRFFDKLIGGWDLIASVNIQDELKKEEEPPKPLTGDVKIPAIKIVGKIDLEKFKPHSIKNDEKLKRDNPISPEIEDLQIKGKFSSIDDFKESIFKNEADKLVPANGVLIKHNYLRGFGFIRIPDGTEIYFSYNDIVDEELMSRIKCEKRNQNIQITYSKSKNYLGDKATAIHLPWKVKDCYELSEKRLTQKRVEDSRNLCNQILNAFPNNHLALELLRKIEEKSVKYYRKTGYFEPIYLRGKKAKDRKDYNEAIKLLKESIEKEEKLDSAVKDLASCYQEIGEISLGIDLIETYLNRLQENTATYNFVANYYQSAKMFVESITYLDKLIDLSSENKQIPILTRKANCLLQANRYQDALGICNLIIKIKPDNPFAVKYKGLISEALNSGTTIELVEDIDSESFTWLVGAATKYISYSLEKCNYSGLTQQEAAKGEFTNDTLKKLRAFIDRAGKSRPRDRAKYQLTEAKLIQSVEPENEKGFREAISKYCNATASALLTENFPPEVIRFFFGISFTFEPSFRSNARQLLYFIMSYKYAYEAIIEKANPALESIIAQIPKYLNEIGTKSINLWDGLLECSINNKNITSYIVNKAFDDKEIIKFLIPIFSNYGIILSEADTKDGFIQKWNQLRERRKGELDKLYATIIALTRIDSLENYLNQSSSFLPIIKKSFLSNLEIKRIEDIFINITYSVNLYLGQSAFDDKERQRGIANGQIYQLIEEIEEQPTRFSFDGLLPLLKHVEILLSQSFKKLLESSIPRVTVTVLGDSRYIDENNNVKVQLSVKNQRGCSPIHDLKISVCEDPNFKVLENILVTSESLKGGEEKIITIPINISRTILEQEATTIIVNIEYRSRERDTPNILKDQPLAVRFYSSEQFVTIPNPYAIVADSGPVKDKNMFFGRENYIDEISNSLLSASAHKFIDIYGQKRSGKSSLLYHLTQKLKASNRFICIDFTLGSTAKYDSASFLWLILDGIERNIENDPDKSQKPKFEAPRLHEILINPAIIFYEKIRDFQKEIRRFDSWQDRKLLLLIDEFTYLYSSTLKKNLDPEFMKTWKAMLEQGLFSAVVVGQDVMPKFKAKFPNEFGVFEDRRLTYLKKEDAEKLIEKPIWDANNNRSRFIGKAVAKILDYTSLNPYYIQIFCARLVDFMNDRKLINVTEADIIEVARSFVEGPHALPIDKFDNLLNAGDADLEAVPQEETLEILRQIANNSRVLGSCPRESISLQNKEYDDHILDDLIKRDVLACPNINYYRIQVQIFNDWLLKH